MAEAQAEDSVAAPSEEAEVFQAEEASQEALSEEDITAVHSEVDLIIHRRTDPIITDHIFTGPFSAEAGDGAEGVISEAADA